MPTCKMCGEEVDELLPVKLAGKTRKLCEDCSERALEEEAILEESEAVVQNMLEFRGRR